MRKLVAALTLALLAHVVPAGAAPIFYDDFESNDPGNLGLNKIPLGWTVTDGTVDVLLYFSCAGSLSGGVCIDLDGSSFDAGVLARSVTLAAGTYTWEFYLRGNDRAGEPGADPDIVNFYMQDVLLGTTGPLAPTAPWAQYSFQFVAPTAGSYMMEFENLGGDRVGAWLDDVSINAVVPEPASMLLVGGGLAAMVARRRAASRRR